MCAILCRVYLVCNSTLPATQLYVALYTIGIECQSHDGFKSQFVNAKPILDKYGFKAAYFIVCNFVGKNAQQMSAPDIVDFIGKGLDQMNWEELKILEKEGNIIGAHTMNHIELNNLSAIQLD
jgi:peptidoglycan/xylan/chitin deacetylase (PgdA/CDA1 family)